MIGRAVESLRAVLVLVAVALGGGAAQAQTTRYVAACGSDSWTGLSALCAAPDGPKRTIQAAINASQSGDTVIVEDGSYTGPGNRDIQFSGRDITLRSRNGAESCRLLAAGTAAESHRAFYVGHGETRACRIDGFTIEGGRVEMAPGGPSHGSAIRTDGSSPTVVNCIIQANGVFQSWQPLSSGAVRTVGGHPLFEGCHFIGNFTSSAGGTGAAVSVQGDATFRDCWFTKNYGCFGGAVAVADGSVSFYRCRFVGNRSACSGAALFATNSTIALSRCRITHSVGTGPALDVADCEMKLDGCSVLYNYTTGRLLVAQRSSVTISHTLIEDNQGAWPLEPQCAVLVEPRLIMRNCAVVDNLNGGIAGAGTLVMSECLVARNVGAAVSAPGAECLIRGCTITGNQGAPAGLSLSTSALITNSIIWGNGGSPIAGNAAARFSIVQGGYPGPGNKDTDPMFMGPGNYRLRAGSPCIDAGRNADIRPGAAVDLAGRARRAEDPWMQNTGQGTTPIVDIGAYEFQGTSCRANCNLDAVLDAEDLLCFKAAFESGLPYGDYNRDGVRDAADFVAYQAAFAAGCP